MTLDPLQLFLQLGVVGAVLFVVWKLGSKWLDRQSETEKARTAEIAEGFKSITASVNSHHVADLASHERLTESHGEVREAIANLAGQLEGMVLREQTGPVRRAAIPRIKTNNGDER